MNWQIILIIPVLALGQFKPEIQTEVENTLMAPCCGGGTLAEHDDNQSTANMKLILHALTDDEFDRENIIGLFEMTYSNESIYRMNFSPATKKLSEIKINLDDKIHPQMTPEEIVDIFAWIHTERIRSMPKHTGLGMVAWQLPALLLIIGIILITFIIRSLINKTIIKQPIKSPSSMSELETKIEKEMKELNL